MQELCRIVLSLIQFHRIHPWSGGAIEIPPSTLPNLVSLQIIHMPLCTNQRLVTFPVLETLTLSGHWSNLQFIAAPKLRNLVIISQNASESEEETMSTLRQAAIRPISLFTGFVSDTYLPELLALWSNLSELHLEACYNDCIPGPMTIVALTGSGVAAPLCSSIRYLTVDTRQDRKNPKLSNMSTRRLKSIVEGRKDHGVIGLQRVMCVWGYNEAKWVDVL
jgi:hypothetical protein